MKSSILILSLLATLATLYSADLFRTCRLCHANFVYTEAEQDFYKSKGFENSPPTTCYDCNRAKNITSLGYDPGFWGYKVELIKFKSSVKDAGNYAEFTANVYCGLRVSDRHFIWLSDRSKIYKVKKKSENVCNFSTSFTQTKTHGKMLQIAGSINEVNVFGGKSFQDISTQVDLAPIAASGSPKLVTLRLNRLKDPAQFLELTFRISATDIKGTTKATNTNPQDRTNGQFGNRGW